MLLAGATLTKLYQVLTRCVYRNPELVPSYEIWKADQPIHEIA
jgi:hypothetical protein